MPRATVHHYHHYHHCCDTFVSGTRRVPRRSSRIYGAVLLSQSSQTVLAERSLTTVLTTATSTTDDDDDNANDDVDTQKNSLLTRATKPALPSALSSRDKCERPYVTNSNLLYGRLSEATRDSSRAGREFAKNSSCPRTTRHFGRTRSSDAHARALVASAHHDNRVATGAEFRTPRFAAVRAVYVPAQHVHTDRQTGRQAADR